MMKNVDSQARNSRENKKSLHKYARLQRTTFRREILTPVLFFLGSVYRSVIKRVAPNMNVKKHISEFGLFKFSAKFVFSDFTHWSGGHNAGFDDLIHTAQGATCVFDVGAHIGLTTMPLARLMKKGGLVVAFEPSFVNRSYLEWHLMANQFEQVMVFSEVVSDTVGDIVSFFEFDDVSGMNGLIGGRSKMREAQVETTTIDHVVAQLGRVPDLIKIDIEGAELRCLKGARKLLFEHKPVIFLSVHPRQMEELGDSTHELEVLLKGLDYEIWDSAKKNKIQEPLVFGEYRLEKRESTATSTEKPERPV
jgi:FkbM family methyltransferase